MALRTDGVSIDIDGDYTETLARVDANKNGIGVFGLSFYQNNTDKLPRWHHGWRCPFRRIDCFG
jgi:phosphate transport system substrate-binding protein